MRKTRQEDPQFIPYMNAIDMLNLPSYPCCSESNDKPLLLSLEFVFIRFVLLEFLILKTQYIHALPSWRIILYQKVVQFRISTLAFNLRKSILNCWPLNSYLKKNWIPKERNASLLYLFCLFACPTPSIESLSKQITLDSNLQRKPNEVQTHKADLHRSDHSSIVMGLFWGLLKRI